MNEAMMVEPFGGASRYKVQRKLYERPSERHYLRALAALTGSETHTRSHREPARRKPRAAVEGVDAGLRRVRVARGRISDTTVRWSG